MALNLQNIESRIASEYCCSTEEIQRVLHDVREAVSGHIFRHELRPRDIFQMRIMTHDEHMRPVPPSEQTYLIINFGKDQLDDDYLSYLRSYYGKIIFFHIYLNHSLIL